MYSEQFNYENSNENGPSTVETGAAVGFDFRSHATDLDSFLSAAAGHHQTLHGVAGYNADDSDEDDMSEEYEDIDEYEQSNGDASSRGELDE